MNDPSGTRFREEQRFATWVLVGTLVTGSITWVGFVWQVILGHPFGSKPAPDWVLSLVFVLAGIGLPLLFARMRLVTEVTDELVRVRLVPLKTRVHRLEEIASCKATEYSPLGDYGGWGIRYGGKKVGWAYNARGNRGVALETRTGERLLIGSQRAEELAEAIRCAREARA